MKCQFTTKFIFLLWCVFATTKIFASQVLPLTITPAENSAIVAGKPFTLTVESGLPGETIGVIVGGYTSNPSAGPVMLSGTGPFEIEMHVPENYTGTFSTIISANNQDKTYITAPFKHNLLAIPEPSEKPVELVLMNQMLYFINIDPSPDPFIKDSIIVIGRYADGSRKNLSLEALGTSYSMSTPDVVKIKDGYVWALAPGETVITVEHAGLKDFATASVIDPVSKRLPAKEHVEDISVTLGGIQRDSKSGEFVQQVTITNIGEIPIGDPLNLILKDLNHNIELINGYEKTLKIDADSHVMFFSIGGDFLAPNESVTETFRFKNTDNLSIQYTPRVFTGNDL